MDETLLSRIEDAGLNASAAPQQRWLDGWLVRTCPGKAKRARCINAVAGGRLSLESKLALADAIYREAGLPVIFRLTRFSQPATLDGELAARGWVRFDDTRVMVCAVLAAEAPAPLPLGTQWVRLGAADYAREVGVLRGSPASKCEAHAQRLALSPVPYEGWAICDQSGQVLACGQFATEADLVGLYDVFTRESARGRGLARLLCQRLLSLAARNGAHVGYLQVDAANAPARRLYAGLGFADGYAYHYRQRPAD